MTTVRTTVLVLEDDDSIRQLLAATLQAEGHGVEEATTVREGRTLASNRRIDVFLVDLSLPDGDGIEFIRWLRTWTHRPVIVLSARLHETHKVLALDAGADDFIGKPFSVAELHARVRVALRHAARTALGGSTRLMLGDVSVDLDARTVERGEERVRLSATQWRLLEALARHAGRVVTSAALLREVWGPGHDEQIHYLRIYIRQLRQKLERDPTNPVYLLNETGVGYRLISK